MWWVSMGASARQRGRHLRSQRRRERSGTASEGTSPPATYHEEMYIERAVRYAAAVRISRSSMTGAGDALVAPSATLDSLMLAALALLMGDILSEAETLIAGKQMIGKSICLVRRQEALRLIENQLPRKRMINLVCQCRVFGLPIGHESCLILLPLLENRIVRWRTFVQ